MFSEITDSKTFIKKSGLITGKALKVLILLMFAAFFVTPSAFAEVPKGLAGFADIYLSETFYTEEKDSVIWKGDAQKEGESFFSKFRRQDPSSMFHGKTTGLWKGDTVIEDRKSWILDGLILEDFAIPERKGPAEIKGFENTGIMVGLKYSFSGFRLKDLRKSINAFLENFDVTAPRGVKNVSVYIAFPEF